MDVPVDIESPDNEGIKEGARTFCLDSKESILFCNCIKSSFSCLLLILSTYSLPSVVLRIHL
jgi:hypothetical protein